MNSTIRNLTLAAAALAALTVIAPEASAQYRGRGRGNEGTRQERREIRGQDFRGSRGQDSRRTERHEWRGKGYRDPGRYAYAPTPRYGNYGHNGSYGRYGSYGHYGSYGYRGGYAAPYRLFSGFRFYAACPGPGYVYVAGYGWVLPPFFGAVWLPGHYDVGGYWVDGFWR